jgi:glycosyltransferase involved in cell wall biosynthesis
MPAFNEETNVGRALSANVQSLDETGLDWEIVVVNDGSSDRTGEIAAERARRDPRVRVMAHTANRGQGAAIRTGICEARGEYVILSPCDSPFAEGELDPFVEQLGKPDVVVGYRANRPGYSWLMRFNSRIYPFVVNTLFRMRLRDFNWIQMYRRSVVSQLQWRQTRIFWTAELLIRARDAGCSIVEVPAAIHARESGQGTAGRPSIIIQTGLDCLRFAWCYWLAGGRH